MTGNDNNAAGTWTCNCGKENTGKFCVKCGSPRPVAPAPQDPVSTSAEWVCSCGKANTSKFCVKCGAPRPAEEAAARQAAEARAVQEAAARRAAEEEAARQVAQARAAQGSSSVPSAKADGNKGMLMKVGIGVAVLLLLIGAYFIFGRKKETPPAPEPAKVETKAETKTDNEKPADLSAKEEKSMDPAVKAEKLKAYGQAMKAVNTQKRQDATSNEKIVFLVYDVQRRGTDLVVYGHFYNGKKNRTITAVKALELDIVLRDMDKELLNEKNIKYDQSFTGMSIPPLKDSQVIKITLPGKAPAVDFNNYTATAHDVHWEAVGK